MDFRGRALDNIFIERLLRNVKYDDFYLKNFATLPELLFGLAEYFVTYKSKRHHQALGYKTPDHVYFTGSGGGAKIPENFRKRQDTSKEEMGLRQSAEIELIPS